MNPKYRVLQIAALLVLTIALSGCIPTKVAKITGDPLSYRNKFVTVRGTVSSTIPIPLTDKGLFEVTDASGSIWVYTEMGLPEKRRKISVTGEVKTGATFANRSFVVVLVERQTRKKR